MRGTDEDHRAALQLVLVLLTLTALSTPAGARISLWACLLDEAERRRSVPSIAWQPTPRP